MRMMIISIKVTVSAMPRSTPSEEDKRWIGNAMANITRMFVADRYPTRVQGESGITKLTVFCRQQQRTGSMLKEKHLMTSE